MSILLCIHTFQYNSPESGAACRILGWQVLNRESNILAVFSQNQAGCVYIYIFFLMAFFGAAVPEEAVIPNT